MGESDKLSDLLEKVHREIIDFLLTEGFVKDTWYEAGAFYVLNDPEGEDHLGKYYEFLVDDSGNYSFTRRLGSGDSVIYRGIDAVKKLMKTMKIKNAIHQAKSEGLYELSEHLTSNVDLDYSDD